MNPQVNYDMTPDRRYRVLILGAGGVGKSAITRRYIYHDFLDVYDPTIEDCFLALVEHPKGPIELEIVDTAGYDQFVGFKDIQIKEADGIIVVIGYDSLESLQLAGILIREVYRAREESGRAITLMVLVNKGDIQNREVTSAHLEELLGSQRISVAQTSARFDKGIKEAFQHLVDKLVEKNPNPSRTPPHPSLQKKKSSWWRRLKR